MASPEVRRLEEAEAEEADQFDRLPDPVVLIVLNRVGDVKALGRCRVVSRRFHALVPQVDSVVVRVDCVISDDHPSPSSLPPPSAADKPRGLLSLLSRGLSRPLAALAQILFPSSSSSPSRRPSSSSSSPDPSSSEVSHHSPTEVLRSFKEIRTLRIELPAGELGVDDGVLLKWKAGFGSTLDSCVILGASSVLSSSKPSGDAPAPLCAPPDDNGCIPESFYTNGSLKLRVVWTISSLIAASARHYLLQPIITEHGTLESLELTDADGQGTLTMDCGQLQELRVRPVSASGSSQRTLVPALNMRLWYAAHLDLPGGLVLKGATLVAIRPSEHPKETAVAAAGGGDGCWVLNAFEEPYRTAARLLVKRRTYCLEMNSF